MIYFQIYRTVTRIIWKLLYVLDQVSPVVYILLYLLCHSFIPFSLSSSSSPTPTSYIIYISYTHLLFSVLEILYFFTPKCFTMYFLITSIFSYIATKRWSKSGNVTLLQYYYLVHFHFLEVSQWLITWSIFSCAYWFLLPFWLLLPFTLQLYWERVPYPTCFLSLISYIHFYCIELPADSSISLSLSGVWILVCLVCLSLTSSLGVIFMCILPLNFQIFVSGRPFMIWCIWKRKFLTDRQSLPIINTFYSSFQGS